MNGGGGMVENFLYEVEIGENWGSSELVVVLLIIPAPRPSRSAGNSFMDVAAENCLSPSILWLLFEGFSENHIMTGLSLQSCLNKLAVLEGC